MAANKLIFDEKIQVRIKAYIKGNIENGSAKNLGDQGSRLFESVNGSTRTTATDVFPEDLKVTLATRAEIAFQHIQSASSPLFFEKFNCKSNSEDIRVAIEALFINKDGQLKPEYALMLNELDPNADIFKGQEIDGNSFTREEWFARCLANSYLSCCQHYLGHLVTGKMIESKAIDRMHYLSAWQHPNQINDMIGANLFPAATSTFESTLAVGSSTSSTATPSGLHRRSLNLSQQGSSSASASILENEWPKICQRMPAGKSKDIVLNPGVMYVKYFATGGLLCSYVNADSQQINMRVSKENVDHLSKEGRAQLAQIENSEIGESFPANTLLAELSAINPAKIASKKIQHAQTLRIMPFDRNDTAPRKIKLTEERTYSSRKTNPRVPYEHNLANDIKDKTVETFIPSIRKNLKKAYSTLGKAVTPELARTLTPEMLTWIENERERLSNGLLNKEEILELRQKIKSLEMRRQKKLTPQETSALEADLRMDLKTDLDIDISKEPIKVVQRELQKSINSDLNIIRNILYKIIDGATVLNPTLMAFQNAIEKNDLSSLTSQELLEIKTRLSLLRDMYIAFNDKPRPELNDQALKHASFQSDIENLAELLRIVDMAMNLQSSKTSQRSFLSSLTSIFSSDNEVDAKWQLKTNAEWKRDYKTLDDKTIERWEKENAVLYSQCTRIGKGKDIAEENDAKDTPQPKELVLVTLVDEEQPKILPSPEEKRELNTIEKKEPANTYQHQEWTEEDKRKRQAAREKIAAKEAGRVLNNAEASQSELDAKMDSNIGPMPLLSQRNPLPVDHGASALSGSSTTNWGTSSHFYPAATSKIDSSLTPQPKPLQGKNS